ncbi:hypothetical protein AEST_13000 [Alishewanella aestuarii B11]|uniref:Uncharacterized protein n=1 Tax=Alishewanella aestuarii B11 TaxID=1197174 RepID=J1Q468_9ALTE|nr:hypothetical protein AEST_13000 [Alishewanella aestuarii B11]
MFRRAEITAWQATRKNRLVGTVNYYRITGLNCNKPAEK